MSATDPHCPPETTAPGTRATANRSQIRTEGHSRRFVVRGDVEEAIVSHYDGTSVWRRAVGAGRASEDDVFTLEARP